MLFRRSCCQKPIEMIQDDESVAGFSGTRGMRAKSLLLALEGLR